MRMSGSGFKDFLKILKMSHNVRIECANMIPCDEQLKQSHPPPFEYATAGCHSLVGDYVEHTVNGRRTG